MLYQVWCIGPHGFFYCYTFTPFQSTGLLLCLLKTIENEKFFNVFRGCTKRPLTWNRLRGYLTKSLLIKVFFSKCYQIGRKLRIWSHLLKKSLMENFIFCAVNINLFPFISKMLFFPFSFSICLVLTLS